MYSQPSAEHDEVSAVSLEPPASPEPVRALVVEDDITSRLLLQRLLEHMGVQVVTAVDGAEAIAKFDTNAFDLVLMDLLLPKIDGREVTRQIKQVAGDQFIPVIFITHKTDDTVLADCVAAGADDFLTKPFSHVLLKAKIEAQLRIRRLHQTLQEKNSRLLFHETMHFEELRVAERILSRFSRADGLKQPNVRYLVRSLSLMNGDLVAGAVRPNGRQIFLVGDFTGHGLSAAVGGAAAYDIFFAMAGKGFAIPDIVPELNRKIRQILPIGRFLAAAFLELSCDRRSLSVWNAGLPDILVFGPDATLSTAIPSNHPPLGTLSNKELELELTTVATGGESRIYAYSDGLLEARNPSGEIFGPERLLQCLSGLASEQSLVDSLLRPVEIFRNGIPQHDDITLLEVSCPSATALAAPGNDSLPL